MMRWFMALCAGLCVALASHAPAFGQTINVDINGDDAGGAGSGAYLGLGAAPDLGIIWNGVTPPGGFFTSGPLVDSTGAPTAVTVSLDAYREYNADENQAVLANALLTDFIYQPGTATIPVGPGGPPGIFSINNLTPGGVYDIYLYSQNGGYSNTASSFTIDAITKIANNDVPAPPPPPMVGVGGHVSFIENTNYVLFSGVVANGGLIVGEFNDVEAANNAAFNGMQIVQTAIPEPASVVSALVACGLLAGGALRRSRAARRTAA